MKKKDLVISRAAGDLTIEEAEVHFVSWEQMRQYLLSPEEGNGRWIFSGSFTSGDLPDSSLVRAIPESENRARILAHMMDEFRSAAPLYISADKIPAETRHLEWLALMHYYTAPTPLMEWSHSPMIAASNATGNTEEITDRKARPVMWALNETIAVEICRAILLKEKIKTEQGNVRSASQPDIFRQLFEFSLRENPGFILPVFPVRKTTAFFARQTALTIQGNIQADFGTNLAAMIEAGKKYGVDSSGLFRKIIAPASIAEEMKHALFAMNITSRTLAPGLRGFCSSLAEFAKRNI